MNNIGLIDIGANLTHPELYNQLDKIVENLKTSNIKKVIITSSNLGDTKTALDIINLYPDLFYTTVGFHPHNAKDFSLDDIDKIHDYGKDKKIVAIGECGLDYYREYSTKEQQIYCFEEARCTCRHVNTTPVLAYSSAQDMHIHEYAKQSPLGKGRFEWVVGFGVP